MTEECTDTDGEGKLLAMGMPVTPTSERQTAIGDTRNGEVTDMNCYFVKLVGVVSGLGYFTNAGPAPMIDLSVVPGSLRHLWNSNCASSLKNNFNSLR